MTESRMGIDRTSCFLFVVETSVDPNATVSENLLQPLPNYLTSKIKPACHPVTLPVGTQSFTNQTALMYTLTGVWEEGRDGSGPTVSPSLTYYQNLLENCSVSTIQINIDSQDRGTNQLALTEWGAKVRTYTTCRVTTASGAVFFNLTQTYDYVPDTTSLAQIYSFLGTGFLSRDPKSRASLWWGESLMSTYWAQMTWLLQNETRSVGSKHYHIRKGCLSFFPRNEQIDMADESFFRFSSQFIEAASPGNYRYPHAEGDNNLGTGQNLAKSVYSIVLTDLGQTSAQPNLLTDGATLQAFSSGLPYAQKHVANAKPGPATQSYDALKNVTGPLAVHPSVISAQYICQVPRRRSTVNLLVAVLVADLVFLRTAWTLYNFTAGTWLRRRDATADHCRGCLEVATAGQVNDKSKIAPAAPSGDGSGEVAQ
ncbi:hypothetical protein PG991_015247 [Apiospora marii]|uniref:Uncharacterized protein n=1 Tax=Apiospora marii TaxID=335849 RepID=A0ABR1R1V4_9PEZI